jgi:cytochrome P450 family 142 subfamily A polypeptide 1
MATHPIRDDIDLLAGAWWAREPHDLYEWMRHNAPVYWDEANEVWGIASYADVMAIERNATMFSSRRSPRPHGQPLPMMISMDNPAHQRRRSLVQRGFTPKGVADKEAKIRQICTTIIDRVSERGECDFIWDIAAPLPLLLIADMLGFPPESYDDLLRWSDDLIRGTTMNPDTETQLKAMEAGIAFREYQLGVIADRKANPGGTDLVSILVHSEIDGERLDDESIVQESLLILIGGDETTRHVISGGMLALMTHPDQKEILATDPSAMESGVEELLRWITPIKNMSRTAAQDVEVGGQQLREGDQLILIYPSANRDENVFADPYRFDVRRAPNPHLAFGFGPHFCLGSALARLELNVMFTELLKRIPDVELANADPLPYRHSNFIVGPEAMPVRFTPTPATANA